MKKITFALVALMAISTSLMAQMKEGKITYERKTNMHRFITDPEMKARIPEFRTDNFELLFNEQSSLFRNAPEDEAPDPFAGNGGGGGGFRFRMPETTTYIDFPSQLLYESRALFEKSFLIMDTVKPMKWKISDETKTILKHVCKKATTTITQQAMGMNIRMGGPGRRNTDSTQSKPAAPKEVELAVWYAEDIPVSIGPDTYNGLPGAILEVDMDNGANVTRATEITSKYPKKELVQPTKGDKMSRAQFQEEMKKLMQNMQQGGGMRFRMNN
jgi:GLPGLI family protein